MSKLKDQLLEASLRQHRPVEAVDADLVSSPFGMLAQESSTLIPIAAVMPSPFQSRVSLDEEHVETLVEAIKEEGLLSPIVVRVLDSNTLSGEQLLKFNTPRYELIAGHHRLEACRRIGKDPIPAMVRHMTDAEAARALVSENTTHKKLSDFELYRHIRMLKEVGAYKSNADLARLLNFSRTKVQFLDAYADLPKEATALLDKFPGLLSYAYAYEMREYMRTHPDLVTEAIWLLSEEKLKQSGIVSWLKRKIDKPLQAYRKEVAIKDGDRIVKLTMTETDAKVTGNIDFDKLHKLIEENIETLRKE